MVSEWLFEDCRNFLEDFQSYSSPPLGMQGAYQVYLACKN